MSNSWKIFILVGIITLFGMVVRINSLSPYLFYPDSYVQIIVAHNISDYGSVIGLLGDKGMLYPDFFGWTRPVYPLLILLFGFIFQNTILVAKYISFFAGVLTIPLAFLFISKALKSKTTGVIASILLCISYNHAIWGGFVLSDTVGVFFLTLFLYFLFKYLDLESNFGEYADLTAGALFAVAVLSRYEYFIILPAVIYLFWAKSLSLKQLGIKILNFTGGGALVFSIAYYFLSPFSIDSSRSAEQIGGFVSSLGGLDLTAIKGFVISDPIIAIAGLLGLVWMLNAKEDRTLATFTLFSIIPLELLYYQTNPEMQRYFVHLLPFLIIPASYAISQAYTYIVGLPSAKKSIIALFFIIGLGAQLYYTYIGLHGKDQELWFTQGYEEKASEAVNKSIEATTDRDHILIASFPEPYYLFTKFSIQSIADSFPFVFISPEYDTKYVYIVEDEGMRKIFPNFTEFLETALRSKVQAGVEGREITTLPVDAIYRYRTEIQPVSLPIVIYKLKLGDLKAEIQKYYETYNPNPLL